MNIMRVLPAEFVFPEGRKLIGKVGPVVDQIPSKDLVALRIEGSKVWFDRRNLEPTNEEIP